MTLQIRPVHDVDIPGVIALITDRIGEEDAPEAELVLRDPGFDRRRWSVAVDGERVVSTMASFPIDVSLGVTPIGGSMIEFVATDRGYEGRGLVRRQFDYHHADLEQRGDLFQLIVGITYFYRRLGYEYALPVTGWREVAPAAVPAAPDGWTVDVAGEQDLAAVLELQRTARAGVAFAASLSADLWRWILRSPVYTTLLARRKGEVEACCRVYLDDGSPYLMDTVASDLSGLAALLAAVAGGSPGKPITALDRPSLDSSWAGIGEASPSGDAYYARIGDPVAFLNAVRPELSRRLGASPLADAAGDGFISLYSSSIRFSYAAGEVGKFVAGPREQAPIGKGGSGVPPDLIASLLVGPLGFAGLADRHPDVNGGKQAELMAALFPPQRADVQSWVIP